MEVVPKADTVAQEEGFGWSEKTTIKTSGQTSWMNYLHRYYAIPKKNVYWEMNVPNGIYDIHLFTGYDWKQSETHVQIENNDNLIVKKTLDRWVWDHSITKAVTITDGKLTLTFLNDDTVITGLWAILSNFENIAFYDGSTTEGLFLGGTDDALSEENVKRPKHPKMTHT